VLRELGYRFDLERVDLHEGRTASGADYATVNPKGYVPALVLDDGQVLTEAAAILQYLADRKPESGLVPPPGDLDHYRLLEWLTFISSEIHKTLGALFNPHLPPACREVSLALFERRCDWLAGALGEGPFLMGERYTIADPYLFTVLSWTSVLSVDLGPWPALQAYLARVGARPAVQETLRAEGLIG
ncbi:MAG: glutathione transferase GstA, partial [Chromatiaceae bacterium]